MTCRRPWRTARPFSGQNSITCSGKICYEMLFQNYQLHVIHADNLIRLYIQDSLEIYHPRRLLLSKISVHTPNSSPPQVVKRYEQYRTMLQTKVARYIAKHMAMLLFYIMRILRSSFNGNGYFLFRFQGYINREMEFICRELLFFK